MAIKTIKGKGIFVTRPDGTRVWYPKGTRVNKTRPVFQQGRGVRLQVRYYRDIRGNSRLVKIKQNQIRAERKADVRVGTGLFDDPLSDNPKVIGVVRPARRKQKNPASRKHKRREIRRDGRGKGKQSDFTRLTSRFN